MNYKLTLIFIAIVATILIGCSTKKNTSVTRAYHEINTRYNIYFNAEQAYNEKLKQKQESEKDNLSLMLDVYPSDFEDELNSTAKRDFDITVDKTTKAIKLHSIKAKPQRDPSKRKDVEYQLWLKQQEFNPFLKNAWLLLGKAEYQNEDYLQSISTLSYVTRIYKDNRDVVTEARIWIAMGYTAMGWFYEAEDIFHKIKISGQVPSSLQGQYNAAYADFLIKKKDYSTAIPYLIKAIDEEPDRYQRTRMKYLLGQLYAYLGEKNKAYEAFDKVKGMNTPYEFSFNANIQQSALADNSNRKSILDKLRKMAKDAKNKEYQDQIYYAIGNVYLAENDTLNAVKNYKLAVEKSTRGGYDKGISLVTLGNIYFQRRDYIKAQPCYSDALPLLSKKMEIYSQVALRSQVLDELVVFVKDVYLQDSLQTLSRMSDVERMKAIDKIIAQQKKADEEERKLAEKQNNSSLNSNNTGSVTGPLFEDTNPAIPTGPAIMNNVGGSSFYFYNKDLVNSGKVTFKQRWGNRKLEDDWRRSNKQISLFTEDINTNTKDSQIEEPKGDNAIPDKYNPEFYLKQIPLTAEAINGSNKIIDDAYFNMGKIYNEKLGDFNLAIDAFETDLRRFPQSLNAEQIYYQLFLIYLRLSNHEMTAYYRNLLLDTFPQSIYAAALSDPDYEWNMRNMHQLESDLYEQTYQAYLAGNISLVRKSYDSMKSKYPLSSLIPKFMFLNALSYAQPGDLESFKSELDKLIKAYPKSDITELATDMLKEAISGREIASDGGSMKGLIWDLKLGTPKDGDVDKGIDFTTNPDDQFILLFLYQSRSVDKNQLIYDIASYNFSKFVYETFDLSFSEVSSLEMLQVKGFKTLDDVVSYVDMAFEKNSLMDALNPDIIPIPISNDNYIALINGKTLNEYFLFFEKNYTKQMIPLIMYWNRQREKAKSNSFIEGKTDSEIENISEQDNTKDIEPSIDLPVRPSIPQVPKKNDDQDNNNDLTIGVGDILDDDQIEKADQVINSVKDIIDNPVEGLKNLLKPSSKEKLTKEEKAAQKEERKMQKEAAKRKKAEEAAKIKIEEDKQQLRLDSINAIQKAKDDALRLSKQAEEQAKSNAKQEKEAARKLRQKELKEREKLRKEKLKTKERERKELLKQREQERKERLDHLNKEKKNR